LALAESGIIERKCRSLTKKGRGMDGTSVRGGESQVSMRGPYTCMEGTEHSRNLGESHEEMQMKALEVAFRKGRYRSIVLI
jgi:hypothetical protein